MSDVLSAEAREFLIEHVYDYENAERRYPETLPQNAVDFTNIDALKRYVSSTGSFWFSKDTMRYFNCRIAPRIIGSRFYISSERMDHDYPRVYTVRWVVESGAVYSFETKFDTLDKAKRFAAKAHELIPFPAV